MAIASSTRSTYASGERQYLRFCQQFSISQPFPATESLLIYFAVYLARSVQHGTIKNYLAAIKHTHSRNGYNLDFKVFLRLQLTLRGIKRTQGSNKKVRRPITVQHLNLFYHLLNISSTNNFTSVMIWAAMTFAFFGFLRIGEMTCSDSFNINNHLTLSDVTFVPTVNPQYMKVKLKVSKTDPFRQGQTIFIGKTNSHICPVQAMLKFLNLRPANLRGPLFQYSSGHFLTRSKLTSELRSLLSRGGFTSSEYAGHSFRIGAATAAAAANMPPWLIKVMGRWSSDCFERYIKTPLSVLMQVTRQLTDLV